MKILDLNRAHGCGNISRKMIQIFGESVALPLKLQFDIASKEKISRLMEISKCSFCLQKQKKANYEK